MACSAPAYPPVHPLRIRIPPHPPRCSYPASNRMVTIGPLIVLGLLGATFHIGVRKIRPVASNLPIRPQAGSRSQSDTNVLQMAERLGSDPVLHRENISDSPSCQDVSHVMELPRFGPVLQRGRHSGGSGDTMTLSRSEHPTTIASYFAGQPRSADGDRESLGGGTANHEDSATEPTRGLVRPSTSLVSEDISLGETQPSLGSVAGAGTGNQANPEEVEPIRYSAGGLRVSNVWNISSHGSVKMVEFACYRPMHVQAVCDTKHD